jgi:hypothetical protein
LHAIRSRGAISVDRICVFMVFGRSREPLDKYTASLAKLKGSEELSTVLDLFS